MVHTRLALILCCVPACAQVTTGSIAGYVYDPSQRPVPRAAVTVSGESPTPTRRTLTDSSGFYRLEQLPPGAYSVSASAADFQNVTVTGVVLDVGARRRVDVGLALSPRRESVQVAGRARAVASDSFELGAVLDGPRVAELPLNRREFLQLALLSPGVLPPVQDSELSSRGSFAMHANGAREEFNNFLLDGADNNDQYENTFTLQPAVDTIQEFRIATNGYSAEYGRNAGGQVNVITRSGGTRWHGETWEYFRNRALDARNFFDASEKPQYARNQFGAGAGGPVWRDRSFIYADYDGLRERRGLTRLATVPTAAQRTPAPGAPVSPVGLRLLDLFPLPNLPGAAGNYLAQPVLRETTSLFHARFDQLLSERQSLTLRYDAGAQDLFEPYTHDASDIPGFGDLVTNNGHNAMIHWQRIFGPRTVNSLRLSFNRSSRDVRPENYRTDVGKLWGVNWLDVRSRDLGFPAINVAGFSLLGDQTQLPILRHTNTYQVADALSIVRGNHSLRLGGEVRRIQLNALLDYFARGSLTFSGAITGSGIGDLIAGLPSFAIQSQFDNPQALRTTAYAGYIQEDWKAFPSLTLNAGLRYEYNSPPTDPRDRMAIFDPRSARVVNVGTGGIPRGGVRPDRNNFAPRAGFAWMPTSGLAVRGGYGVFYETGMLIVNSSLYFNPPYFNVRVFFPGATGLLTLDNPFAVARGITPPPSPNTISPDLTTSYLQHWNLSIERQLGGSTVASLAYAGSKGTHLLQSRDINQPTPGPGPVAARRPMPAFGGIFFTESSGNSIYNSLQASIDRRLAHGFSLLAAYTFSKSIDGASAFLISKPDKNFPQDSHDLRAERAVSAFDMRHRFTTAWVYAIPGRAWWRRNLEVRGIATAQSGQPFTPYLRFDNSNTGNTGGIFGLDRPDLLRDPALEDPSPGMWFDTSAIAIPAKYHFGSAGRNILRGPGLVTIDAALSRRFILREGISLSFDAELFNLLNHTNFDLPERYADEPTTFGRIFSAKAPRQVQFALRLAF